MAAKLVMRPLETRGNSTRIAAQAGLRAPGGAVTRPAAGGSLAAVLVLLGALIGVAPAAGAQTAQQPMTTLPMGFRGISLGMGLDQVKEALKSDPLFRYRGDPDVSFLPQTSQYLIECEGATYVRRAYFQFADSRLYIMILVLDTGKLDHFSMFSALSGKYGPPASLSPQETVWQSDLVRFSLERPLTVKYIDNKTFSALLFKGGAQKDIEQLSREKFIGEF